MNRIGKLFISVLLVIGLLAIVMIPAFGYTVYYWTNQTHYSSGYNCPGSYSSRYGYYTPTKPVNPTQPPVTPRPTPPPPQPAPKPGGSLSAEESKMVNLVNQERMNQGVRPLGVNQQLVDLARKKSQDMVDKNYFSHTSPTYGSPFDMMNKAGIKYRTAGENIAGAGTTESAHQNLMNSPGHRANILNPSFTEVGIGIASGSIYGNIFTQMFIGN